MAMVSENIFDGEKGDALMTVAEYLKAKGREEGVGDIFEAIDLIEKCVNLEVIAKETNLSLERVR